MVSQICFFFLHNPTVLSNNGKWPLTLLHDSRSALWTFFILTSLSIRSRLAGDIPIAKLIFSCFYNTFSTWPKFYPCPDQCTTSAFISYIYIILVATFHWNFFILTSERTWPNYVLLAFKVFIKLNPVSTELNTSELFFCWMPKLVNQVCEFKMFRSVETWVEHGKSTVE